MPQGFGLGFYRGFQQENVNVILFPFGNFRLNKLCKDLTGFGNLLGLRHFHPLYLTPQAM